MDSAPIKVMSRKEKLGLLIKEMQSGLLEREQQTKLILLAALSGEHVLLLGPPGTAKSELAKRLKNAFFEADYFERLLTRFTVPEELFGPLSIKALEDDRYHRLTSGYLPEASVAFIDEIFKANSAILNSLLTLLNERQFDNGNTRKQVPLISVIAASNELPEGEELNALYDRFMLRSFVEPVSGNAFQQLLTMGEAVCDPALDVRLRIEDLGEVQAQAEKVGISKGVLELCQKFREYLVEQDIYVSDRRWRKVIKLIKVSALTNNQTEANIYDAWILPHCLWEKPEQLEGLVDLYKKNIAIDADFNPKRLQSIVSAWESYLQMDIDNKKQVIDDSGQPLYIDDEGDITTSSHSDETRHKINKEGKPLYTVHNTDEPTVEPSTRGRDNDPIEENIPNIPLMETILYSKAHVEGRINPALEAQSNIETVLQTLRNQRDRAKLVLCNHLWIDASIFPELDSSLRNAISKTEELLERMEKVITGFEELPRESSPATSAIFEAGEVKEGELCD
ncbi:MoxR-like ATPase [Marinobacterium halophilum]|uniref:MoxR-like ATPase n=1 Tax=Marinobacterium halophilum TaxID=267374 RepID=A0A2P8EUF2_9GAMM|nr:AAA family ATPase [Marinobacterium halophilum]PSL13093.1 MoxR-like ATPase [Marinobacterium halophilum]